MSLSILCPSPCLAFFNIFKYHKRKISRSIIVTLYYKQYRCNLIMNRVDNKTNKQKCGLNIPMEKCCSCSCSFSPPSWSYDQAKLLSGSFRKVRVFKQTVNGQFEGNFYICTNRWRSSLPM